MNPRQPGDANRRMRRLQRLEMRLEEIKHRIGLVHRPVLAGVGERRRVRPKLQDDLQRLARHVAVLPAHAVDIEHRPVARQTGCRHTKIQPALGEVIEHGNPVRKLGGVMIGQQKAAGAEPDVSGLAQSFDDQKVRGRMRLPGRGVMLADPAFLVAEFIEPPHYLQIEVVSLLQTALRRMRRHREISQFHERSSLCLSLFSKGTFMTSRVFFLRTDSSSARKR
jgi:hypothetical protein